MKKLSRAKKDKPRRKAMSGQEEPAVEEEGNDFHIGDDMSKVRHRIMLAASQDLKKSRQKKRKKNK